MNGCKLQIHSLRQIVQVVNDKSKVLKGNCMKDIAVINSDENNLSIVVNSNGIIEAIGNNSDISRRYSSSAVIIDGTGRSLIPGLVDGHTHTVWAGDRVHEFAMKLAGASYMEVHAAGGGINYTVDCVRKASQAELYKNFKSHARKMIQAGTTLAECKSGYGLDTDNEIKMLKVLNQGINDPEVSMDISVTYCGAHSVPKGSTDEEATDDVINRQLPAIQALMQSGELVVHNMDVFCEKGVFNVEQTRRMLAAGQKAGLALNFHAEELNRLHSAEMGAALNARAMSHLEEVSDEGIAAMAKSSTIAVILPSTAYILRLRPPPVRRMIDSGVAVALGSDFNPNAHCLAMPVIMHLACVLCHMSMNEALVAATINAAASVGKSDMCGSIEVGKMADFVLIDAPRWEHLIYQLGGHNHLISHVIKAGDVVYQRPADL